MRYAAMLWGNVKAGIGGGNDGITPHIGPNGNWWIGEADTGVKAEGTDGEDGTDGTNGIDGVDGDSAYVYIAYASDDSGTGFTTTFNPALDYIAILATDTEILTPAVGDFAGLWKKYKGDKGLPGDPATNTDETVKYDAADPAAGYLSEKIVAGTGITIAEGTGADENKVVVTAIGGGGANTFIELTDTPSAYTGQAGKVPIVNATEDGLEFVSICDLIINCTIVQQIINVIEEEHNLFFQTVNFGLLYNRYAAQDNISQLTSSDDWGLPTTSILLKLRTYVGGNPPLGGMMKEVNLNSWQSISPLSDNSLGLNFKGAGTRDSYNFRSIKQRAYVWHTGTINRGFSLVYNTDSLGINTTGLNGNEGGSVRLVRAASGQADGKKGIYIGNNRRVYRTIVVNEIEWLADNLAETKWRSGTDILEITDLSTWMSTTDPALCAYNNDWSNV